MPLTEGDTPKSKWAIQSAPHTGLAFYTQVTGISCTSSPLSCMAAGWYYHSLSGADDAITLAYSGALQSPEPAQPNHRQVLNGISCPAPNSCEAAGTQNDMSGAGMTLAEFWNGTTWTVQPTKNP